MPALVVVCIQVALCPDVHLSAEPVNPNLEIIRNPLRHESSAID